MTEYDTGDEYWAIQIDELNRRRAFAKEMDVVVPARKVRDERYGMRVRIVAVEFVSAPPDHGDIDRRRDRF